MKISIIIPSYNEERRIGRTLKAYSEFFEDLRKKKEADYEILVVINNTTDKTEEIVKDFRKKNKRIIYLNFRRGGKGFAVIEGFKDALKRNSDLIGFTDADMATPPESFYLLVQNIGGGSGAIASRYIKGSKILPKPSFRTLVMASVFNFIVRSLFLFNFRDTQCGAKLFRREAVSSIIGKMTITQWAFDIDLLYQLKRKGFAVKEIPIKWVEQEESKINMIKSPIQMFLSIIQLRVLNSPFNNLLKPLKIPIRFLWRAVK